LIIPPYSSRSRIAPISFKAKRILFKPWLIGKGFCYGCQASTISRIDRHIDTPYMKLL
jgi:hypothetical protein